MEVSMFSNPDYGIKKKKNENNQKTHDSPGTYNPQA